MLTIDRLQQLQQWLTTHQIRGLVIPSTDEYLSEYAPACNQRLTWASGFNGSVGQAIVLQNTAALFVDGRYTEQAKGQVPTGQFEVLGITDDDLEQWLTAHITSDDTIIFDPAIHTQISIERLDDFITKAGGKCLALASAGITQNPIDVLWQNRPSAPNSQIEPYPLEYAGISSADKRAQLAQALQAEGLLGYLITSPEELAWLLNIRASDNPIVPIAFSFALVLSSGDVEWFIDAKRVSQSVNEYLGEGITIYPPVELDNRVRHWASPPDSRLGINQPKTPLRYIRLINSVGEAVDHRWIDNAKASKNTAELDYARRVQHIDAIALIRFLAWLDRAIENEQVSELQAAAKVTALRAEADTFICNSFHPISASGPNAAMAHYTVSEQTNRILNQDSIYLLDSGGQYYGGTTDITRTVAIGEPTPAQIKAYTLVLKGHIALANARFPEGTKGYQLDILARHSLWQQGMNYSHGTGHGVGSCLNVHEGPASIGVTAVPAPLTENMILSNEPGHYIDGEYGMRIENLVVVKQSEHPGFLAFETITFVPLEPKLVDFSLLSQNERQWLHDYHQNILETSIDEPFDVTRVEKTVDLLSLDLVDQQWLDGVCRPFLIV